MLELSKNEVHVWMALLDQHESIIELLVQSLSSDEEKRAERFFFAKDRKSFIIGRGLLRSILGFYLNIDPTQVNFCYGEKGKPALDHKFGKEKTIHFNLSHSGNLVIFGFTRSRKVGVDIERIRVFDGMEKIAERFFSNTENELLLSLPSEERTEAFFNCWTRKEAIVKAAGDGLTLPLNEFDVMLEPGESALSIDVDIFEKNSHWSLHGFQPARGYVAAVAIEGQSLPLRFFGVDGG